MDKKEKQRVQEDASLNKVLFWFGGAVLLEALLMLMNRYRVNFFVEETDIAFAMNTLAIVLTWVGLAGGILLGLWAARRRRAGHTGMFIPALSVFLLSLFVCGLICWRTPENGIPMLTVLVPVAAVLALVYYLYQREFFTVALVCAVGIIGLWVLFQLGASGKAYGLVIAGALFLLLVAVLGFVLQRKDGVLTVKGHVVQLLPKKANYALIYVSCALMMVVLLLAVLLMGSAIPDVVWYAVPVAWTLIMAVYYTVKLM